MAHRRLPHPELIFTTCFAHFVKNVRALPMYVSKPPLVQRCGFADAFWCCLLMVSNLFFPLSSQPPNHCAVRLSFGGGVVVTFLWWPWGAGGGLAAGCYYDRH